MLRSMKQKAAWLIAATVLLSGLTFAQRRDDDDDDHGRATRDYRHDRDHDGDRDRDHDRGRHNGWWHRDRDDRRWNDHDRDDRRWNDHDRNDRYRNNGNWGYRNYPQGGYSYPSGGYGYPSGGYGYPSGGYYPNGGYGYPSGGYGNYGRGNSAYNFGYQDGAMVARQDMSENKPYHPDVRGKYEDADHGYNSAYGDKQSYRAQYMTGYRQGYMSAYRGRRY